MLAFLRDVGMLNVNSVIEKMKHPTKAIIPLDSLRLIDWMPDEMFVKLAFRGELGQKLDLKNPKSFNEKLQWLKLYDHKTEYIDLVDKLKAKSVVGNQIGSQHIVPLYGHWKTADEIAFETLPDKFVLKCNHDQGSVILVSDKNRINKKNVIDILNKKLKRNNFYGCREYPYKYIKPEVFAEEYLGSDIIDYKFYCFNGKPKFLYCGQGLTEDHSLKIDFFDLDWNIMPFYRTDYRRLGSIPKPLHLDEMIDISKKLSKDIPFVRIDLFEVNGKVYFSEFTLCPAAGFMPFVPKEYDWIVGEWLKLPVKKRL